MNYYKIYTKDSKNRDTIRLLKSKKSFSKIQKDFEKVEELFKEEFDEMKKHVPILKKDAIIQKI